MARRSEFRMLPFLAVALACCACGNADRPLQLADLDEAEHAYVTRVIVLERAKALAVVAPERGAAVLDSLAAAWGDSSLSETVALAPSEPRRAEQVALLLVRVLSAEQDSLLAGSPAGRLHRPLPDPPPPDPSAP